MKKLPDDRHANSTVRAGRRIPLGGRGQDRAMVITCLIAGVVLILACGYSLTQLSEFYGLIIAVQAAGSGRYIDYPSLLFTPISMPSRYYLDGIALSKTFIPDYMPPRHPLMPR